jgi:hypothetical protein
MDTIADISAELDQIRAQSLWKTERPILGHQSAHIAVAGGRQVLNFCANNYLGLADHPDLVAAAKAALDSHGLGMASVRFICGTSDLHLALERRIADYLGTDDAILFAACFDANGAVFEPLFGEPDAIVSDALNHASIIDGIRLSKARRYRFANGDMNDLEAQLKAARGAGAHDDRPFGLEPGLGGVQICATPSGGGAATCATSDPAGRYLLAVPFGSYAIAPAGGVPSGVKRSPPSPRIVVAAAGPVPHPGRTAGALHHPRFAHRRDVRLPRPAASGACKPGGRPYHTRLSRAGTARRQSRATRPHAATCQPTCSSRSVTGRYPLLFRPTF